MEVRPVPEDPGLNMEEDDLKKYVMSPHNHLQTEWTEAHQTALVAELELIPPESVQMSYSATAVPRRLPSPYPGVPDTATSSSNSAGGGDFKPININAILPDYEETRNGPRPNVPPPAEVTSAEATCPPPPPPETPKVQGNKAPDGPIW